ncbi:MAG: molybdopterin-dependent oxidoreductase [Gracilibacteraceae bacterium]|jgi:molybdopterin-containing oxidoreductase family molybdopterin binding subunit|nr:molybdopterin-dependent oxidoreductase [Gracilibacteraceae bacterium]
MAAIKEAAIKEDVWIPSACNMCFNACAIRVHKVDGVVVKIEGNPASPVGGGHVCGKGASGLMQLYDPNRITKPMKRTNPVKGIDIDPGWQEISWEEAYTLAADKLKAARAENPKYILSTGMVTNNANLLPFIWFASPALGGGYWCADICGASIHGWYERFGATGNLAPDYELCKYLLQFGTQAGTATRHGFNMSVRKCANGRENGLKLVSVDPHMSTSAEKSDLWLPIKPGTDGALAMAIAHVLVRELGIYDAEYLKKFTNAADLVDVSTGMCVRKEIKETKAAKPAESKKDAPEKIADKDIGAVLKGIVETDNADQTKHGHPYVWDLATGQARDIYDDVADKALLGTYTFEGKTVKPSFQVYVDHLKSYTPEWAAVITDIPAERIRQVAKELGEAASIGSTITIGGKSYPYRPVAVDCFSGATRHKHAYLTIWAILHLNVILGSFNVPGGMVGFAVKADGHPETHQPSWAPGVYERDNMVDCTSLFYVRNRSCYADYEKKVAYRDEFDWGLFSLQPTNVGGDGHFVYSQQLHPEQYKQKHRAKVLFSYASNPLKNWGNHAEMAEFLKTFEYIIMIDIYKSDSSYFADLLLPECCYLERLDSVPNAMFNHHTVGDLNTPWTISIRQPVVQARDNCPGGMDIFIELADRVGVLPMYNSVMSASYRLNEANKLDPSKKYSYAEILDRVYKSWCGEDKGLEWFKKNGVLTWERKPEELYYYPNNPGRIPLYMDYHLKLKKEVEAEVKRVGIEWEQLEDYLPLPSWEPCLDYEEEHPGYDLWPIYYTNALNVDTWGQINPWINEINASEPYGYTIEINTQTAKARGLKTGDDVVLLGTSGYEVEGRLMCVQGIHPKTLAVGGGCWDIKSKYLHARDRGVAINNLFEVGDPKRLDHLSAAYDQCIRVKLVKKEAIA